MFGRRKGIRVKQHDITDCGAACLASVCAYYGLQFPVARIRQYAFTDQKGTNILGMVEAANRLGLSAKGVRAEVEALFVVPKPMIAHVVVKERLQHFVVVYKATEDYIEYMDPGDGEMHLCTTEDFLKEWTGVLILMEPEKTFRPGNEKTGMWKKFLSLVAPHKSVMLQAVFGALIYSILGLSTSIYVGKITDYVLVDKNLNLLNLMGVVMIGILLLRTFVGAMKSILALKTGQQIDAALILGYYKHLLRLPQLFFDTMRVGEIISRVNDAVKIRAFINNVSLNLVVNAMILLFSVGLMFVYSWKLALLTLASAPLFWLIFRGFNRLNRKYQRHIMESTADLEAQLVESVNSISTIKRFGIEEYANLKTETRFVHLLKNTYHSMYGSIMAQGGIQFVSTGITIAILWLGSVLVIDQTLTPGTLMVFYSLVGYVVSPIGSLISSNQTIQDALIAADRLFQIMDLEREQDEEGKTALASEQVGNIVFEDVSFRYGSRKEVFSHLNLEIEKGKMTAIVGESGSGKTTLMSLLQHIYGVQSGHIRIGAYDIADIDNKSLRQRIGVVPQQVELFSSTILENVAVGELRPDKARVNALLDRLGLRDFIDNQPKGIKSQIGEHGVNLSGGERQRLAVARALYQDPDIVILDEATSSLDNIAERYVKEVMEQLKQEGKTVIVIAHRLSTVKTADRIVVLQQGQVREEGTHEELTKADGLYRKLWREQFDILD